MEIQSFVLWMQTFAQNKYLIYLKKKNNIKKLILYLHP